MNSLAYATFLESQRLGVSLTIDERGRLSATFLAGARKDDVDALRRRLREHKAELVHLLQVPQQAAEVIAVKVWSEVLQEAIWVVADGVPIDDYLSDGRVFTHREVRALLARRDGIKMWAGFNPAESAA